MAESSTNKDDGLDRKTLFVRLIPFEATSDDLQEYFSQFCPVKHAVVVNDENKKLRGFGFVSFVAEDDTLTALVEAKKTKFQDRFLRVDIAKRRDRKRGEGEEPKPKAAPVEKRKARLIVRNLPWSCKDGSVLKKVFSKYGAVADAYIPRKSGGQMCGFGFVVMKKQAAANKAVKESKGLKIDGREVAVDIAMEKSKWESRTEEEIAADEAEDDEEDDEDKDDEDEVMEDAEDKADSDNDDDDDDDDDEDDGSDSEFDDLNKVDPNAEEEELKLDDDDDDEEEEEPAPRKKANRQEPFTIFVRNIPYDADEDTLKEHFERFGAVKYALPVRDRVTGFAKGLAFVAFVHKNAYEKCLDDAPSQALTSVLIPDDVLSDYVYQGRILLITLAVDRSLALRLEERNSQRRQMEMGKAPKEKDKRNLFLLNEGRITANSALAKVITAGDLAIREQLYKLRVQQLNKNPSLHMSLTRLAIRNLPRQMNLKGLKALGRKAVVQFATEVKQELRQPLNKEEVNRSVKHRYGENGDKEKEKEAAEAEEKDKKRKTKNTGVVKQAKVIMEVKGTGEHGRLRGYGFVEFRDHKAALMGLRWLNAHEVTKDEILAGYDEEERKDIQIDGKSRRLIVEFAIENSQVIKKRHERYQALRDPERKRRREEKQEEEQLRKRLKQDKRKGGKKGNMNKGPKPAKTTEKPEKDQAPDHVKRIIAQKRRQRKNK